MRLALDNPTTPNVHDAMTLTHALLRHPRRSCLRDA
jgi:hypothetical protein